MPAGGGGVFASVLAAPTGVRRPRSPHLSIHEHLLAAAYAQVPIKWALGYHRATDHISDVAFDQTGEFIASVSTDGRVMVHQTQQFACVAPTAEQTAALAADRAADTLLTDCARTAVLGEAIRLAGDSEVHSDPQPPSATTVQAHGMRVAAQSAAARAEHSSGCEPLLSLQTGHTCCA